MASRTEVSQIVLPGHVEDGVNRVYESARSNPVSGYGRITGDLKQYMIDTVLDDEAVHPVAMASLVASISSSLVNGDKTGKYHPLLATQRKLTAMRAFLGSMRPDGIVLLDDTLAIRNTDNPQLVGLTSVDYDSHFPTFKSSVSYQFADIAQAKVGEYDPFDIEFSREPLNAKDSTITLDGTYNNNEYVLRFLTGLDQYGTEKVRRTMDIGVARDGELYEYVAAMYAEDPPKNSSIAYPPTVLNALGAAVAIRAVAELHCIALPAMTHEEVRQGFREQISHTLVSLAMRQEHQEGVSETRYCCPNHGSTTSFRRRQNKIAAWSVEQLGIVLECLDLEVDDLTPEQKDITPTNSIGEVVSDVINHEAVDAVMRDLRLRLSSAQ